MGKAEASKRIVAITDAKRGALRQLATEEGYKTFVIEDSVGGRFLGTDTSRPTAYRSSRIRHRGPR